MTWFRPTDAALAEQKYYAQKYYVQGNTLVALLLIMVITLALNPYNYSSPSNFYQLQVPYRLHPLPLPDSQPHL